MVNPTAGARLFYGYRLAIMIALTLGLQILSIRAAASGDSTTAGYTWTVRNQEQAAPVTGGVFRAGGQRPRLTIDTPLAENMRLTVAARMTRSGGVRLVTGRRNERLATALTLGKAPTAQFSYTDPSGNVTVRRTLRLGEGAKPNSDWAEPLLEWCAYYRALKAAQIPEERWMRIELELRSDRCRFLVDGRLVHEWAPTDDLYGSLPVIELDPGAEVRLPEVRRLAAADPLYLPIDISASFNAAGLAGEAINPASLPVRGTEFTVEGVPFVLGEAAAMGFDNLDVGLSWFREGNLVSCDEEPHKGSFGGRWTGSFGNDPTRFQFPLPRRSFTALHLLAASESKLNALPRLTAQFFRPRAGFPKSFASGDVPLATAALTSTTSLPVKTASGKALHLWHVSIPIEPGLLQEFEDLDVIEVELTKDVQVYRSYPDPDQYSAHAGGLPSAVRVFAMTMGVAPVEIRFEPEALGNVWVEAAPAYRVTAHNNTAVPQEVQLDLMTVSHDGSETNQSTRNLTLPPAGERAVRFDLSLQRYGHHNVTLLAACAGVVQTHARTLSRLRRRENVARPFDAKGFMFGYWNWRGGHHTPSEADELRLMGALGMESTGPNPGTITTCPETIALAGRYGIRSFWGGARGSIAANYPENPAQATAELERKWRAYGQPLVTPTHEPTYVNFFAEPGGLGTRGVFPEFYGEPPFKLDEVQQKAFKRYHDIALISAKIAKKWNPDIKILFPWGDPCFTIPFLQANDKLTKLIDGVGLDFGYFDRIPEMQMHHRALHRTYQFVTYWKRVKKTPPVWPCVEGPCIAPVAPGALTPQQHADHIVRSALILSAYGVNRHLAMGAPADCANWWGEQHYGGGFMSRLSGLNPYPAYSALGALIRNLRHMELIDWMPTGSLSVYCLHFRDSRDGKSLYVLWTLRGKREIAFALPKGTRAEWFDDMDNMQRLVADDAGLSFTISTSPGYLYGAGENPAILLGASDHSDSLPALHTLALGNVANHFATQGDDADPEYIDSFPEAIRRFPATMHLARTHAPAAQGGVALAVTLPPQAKDRGVMPFYTTLKPANPITIPGKGSHLTLWVRGVSDWGRMVYVLRDANGEKWTSAGTVGEGNSDDAIGASAFNFDGWRLVRFDLPSHAPYDSFREMGTTWWGSSGGDAIVDLPLSIEKIFIERRPKAMYANSLEPTDPAPVLLGDLAVEYGAEADMGDEAVILNRVRMPPPPAGSPRVDPTADTAGGVATPSGTE